MEEILRKILEASDKDELQGFIDKYISPAKQAELLGEAEIQEKAEKQQRLDKMKIEVTKLEGELNKGVKR